jgi:predicted phage terminase large subunit-like protein
MIFVQPQVGKSEIVSRMFPAWMLGIDPSLRIILASYSADLATGFNRDCQKIIDSEDYSKIFPDTFMNGRRNVTGRSWKRTSDYFETVGHGGYLYSVGTGGSTTGKSADIFIVDDPIKDMKQAYSSTYRAAIIDWYNSVALTRMSLNGHIIIMHTRWHEKDLAGQLIEKMKEDPLSTQWEIISLPTLAHSANEYKHPEDPRNDGEPLWPSWKGDVNMLRQLRTDVGEKTWSSLYQQSPTVEGGNIIKTGWLKYWQKLPFDPTGVQPNKIIQSWDLTFKSTGSSYVVGVVIVKHDADFYIIDFYRAKADIVTTIEAIKGMTKKYPFSSILIEDKANGPAVLSILKKELSRMIPVRPTAGKDERLHVIAPLFEAGNVLLPMHSPWTREVTHELEAFPNSANDDIVDAISQGLQHWNTLSGTRRLEAMSRL